MSSPLESPDSNELPVEKADPPAAPPPALSFSARIAAAVALQARARASVAR
jgi:hypothetical protein